MAYCILWNETKWEVSQKTDLYFGYIYIYICTGLELEVKRGTAKIGVEGLVKRRAPQHFQLKFGRAPRQIYFSKEGHQGIYNLKKFYQ